MPVKSWFDDTADSELHDLIPLFEKLSKVDSVYSVLCNSNQPMIQQSGGGGGGGGGIMQQTTPLDQNDVANT